MDARLTPELVFRTYVGSPVAFMMTPTAGGSPIDDLADYDQIEFSWWSGDRYSPGEQVLEVKYTGTAPNYITVEADPSSNPAIQVTIPGTVSINVPAGDYFAELWMTPPGGEPTFTGWAVFHHEPTTHTAP